jgi:TonB family protein
VDDPETAAKKAAALKALRGDDSADSGESGETSSSSTGGAGTSSGDSPEGSSGTGTGAGQGSGTGLGKGSGSGGGEGSGTGTGKGSGTDPGLLDAYNQVIKAKCETWEQPVSEVEANYKFTTTMTLTISKTGVLESYTVKNSSGNAIVDGSVKAFLGSIRRFPAPPTGKEYVININFELGGD